MVGKLSIDSIVKLLLLCGWGALFFCGVTHYSGSWLIYTLFSIVFFAMLMSGMYRQVSYGYLFLVTMLWLGFWLKLTIHLIVDYPYVESIGSFDLTGAAWDEVLNLAIIGSLGVMAGRVSFQLLRKDIPKLGTQCEAQTVVPFWYPSNRRWVWAAFVFVCIGLAIINASLGIFQIGLVPKTILLWPLVAVISWLMGNGFALGVATLLWWEIGIGRNISSVVYSILLEAFCTTVSTLSRGAYIFHVIPQFLALYKHRQFVSGWTRRKVMPVCVVFIALFALTNPLVNSLRSYYYSNIIPSGSAGSMGGGVVALARFAVDRWVGLEGVMAISAYSKKGADLLSQGLLERREVGKDTLYVEIVRPVYYGVIDKSKFEFSEIPGAIAFLYYGNQFWIVAFGMFLLVFFVLASEALVLKLTLNPLVGALWGGVAANAVAQMGVAPRSLLIFFLEMISGIAAICLVQSAWFSGVVARLAMAKIKAGS